MATLFRKILCPIQYEDNSLAALDLAREQARELDGEIVLMHVVNLVPTTVTGVPMEPFPRTEADAREELERIARQHLAGLVRYRVLVATGDPARLILRRAEELAVDSIVMATHGRKGIGHLLLGSVAERVVREAPCPVLTVRVPAAK